MFLRGFLAGLLGSGIMVSACSQTPTREETGSTEAVLKEKAVELAHKLIIVDTHIDVPYRLENHYEDISKRTEQGDFDYPRARQGGLDAAFFSIYVPAESQVRGGAKALADRLIDQVEGLAGDWPDHFRIAFAPESVRENFRRGLISIAMGMENGAPLEDDLDNVQHFFNRGIRYITLTHSKANQICDSSYDPERRWNGLSPFGREVVVRMNRLGIMVDISHVSDEAFYQVAELSTAPLIASHSSCRHFTPGWERNMSDEMVRRLAATGGVIQINFGSDFISNEYRQLSDTMREEVAAYLDEHKLRWEDPEARDFIRRYRQEHSVRFADVTDVVDHMDHVVRLVGVDHVGFGSDFDGVGDSLPTGLKDVSGYPNLIYELLRRGYRQDEIEKICSGNLLRVWSVVQQVARDAGGP